MKNRPYITLKFSMLMITLNMAYAVFGSYGTVYLLKRGYQTGTIGTIIAMAAVMAALLQPLMAKKADQSLRFHLGHYHLFLLIPAFIFMGVLLWMPSDLFWIGVVFCFVLTLVNAIMPLLNAVGMVAVSLDYPLDYGTGRAMGSLSYAVFTALLAWVLAWFGPSSLIVFAMMAMVLYVVFLWQMPLKRPVNLPSPLREAIVEETVEDEGIPQEGVAVVAEGSFFAKYPAYSKVLMGVIAFFIFHSMVNTYLFQVVANVGGGEQAMSNAFTLGAMVEIPIMILYRWYHRWFSLKQLMLGSAIFFLIKAGVTLMAVDVNGIYLAQALQMFAYGLYATVSIHYAYQSVAPQDLVKGQSYLITGQTLGGVVGTLVGGYLIQYFSVKALLVACVFVSMMGVIAFWQGLKDRL